jgi:hypothetical protein
MSTTTNLTFLQRNLLDDVGTAIWTADELRDDINLEMLPFFATLQMVSTTTFHSGKTFWCEPGTLVGQSPVLTVSTAGTPYGTSEYTVDYLKGEVTFGTGVSTAALIEATFYASDLYAAAKHALLRRMNSTAITGQQSKIRLGPLAKETTGPQEMVVSFSGKIEAFSRFSQIWRAQANNKPRIRM